MSLVPCKSCPWKVSTKTEDIPGGGMDHVAAERAAGNRWGGKVMACHLSTDEQPHACAGWIEKVAKPAFRASGERAIPMRLLILQTGIELDEYSDGGEKLHRNMAAMLAAHPDPDGD